MISMVRLEAVTLEVEFRYGESRWGKKVSARYVSIPTLM
jgi:hypothetical protein